MADTEAKRPLRALLVEDSETDAELLLKQLERGGYDVTSTRVETAAALKFALEQSQWDLIVSDYSMPRFDALKALAVLKESGCDLPFIVVSGTIGEETAVQALRSGAHDFLSKGKLARLLPAIDRELRETKVREARRRAERELRASEQRYRRIVETTNEGVWEIDAGSSIAFVNARMATLLQWSEDQILGRPVLDFVHDESRRDFAARLELRAGGSAGHTEMRLRKRDGSDLWVLLDLTSIVAASGEYQGALIMAVDVTARKRLEDQLLQAQKLEAVGRLAGGVAHDFNNLLSVILSYAAFSLDALDATHPIRADLEEVIKAGERAADLTHQLLAFSRRQVLEFKTLDLNQVLSGMQKMLRRLLREHIELRFIPAQALGKVRADPGQMEQVVMNLVVNAQDAMPNGGRITIETADAELDDSYAASHFGVEPGHYVMLTITDTGAGIDRETRTRIFEPFFTTKEKGKGTGLGLATVLGIVEQSRGHISVQSEPGVGTTFRIYLPRTEERLDSVIPPTPLPATFRGDETILLVEDEDSIRAVLRTVLVRHGYTVLEAQNGGEAFLLSERYRSKIQLLITDLIMPRMSGRELAERLQPTRPKIKVLYVSGYTEDSAITEGVLGPGIAFLQKPIRPDAFLCKVRNVLDSPMGRILRDD
jgi:PAS domain S-box-containing protein